MKMFLGVAVIFIFSTSAWAQTSVPSETVLAQNEGSSDKGSEDPWSVPTTTETKPAEETPEVGPAVVTTRYPISEVDRPLSLPSLTLEPRLSMNFDFIEGDPDNWVSMRMGAGFGITDAIEAGMVFPFSFAPEFKANDFNLYGQYELPAFLEQKLRVAARLTMAIPMSNYALYWTGYSFAMHADGLVKFKIIDLLAVTGGVGMGFAAGKDEAPSHFLLRIDTGVLVQPIEELSLATNFNIHANLGDGDHTFIQLMFRGQYTLLGDLDVFTEMGFPDLDSQYDAIWFQWIVGAAYRFSF